MSKTKIDPITAKKLEIMGLNKWEEDDGGATFSSQDEPSDGIDLKKNQEELYPQPQINTQEDEDPFFST